MSRLPPFPESVAHADIEWRDGVPFSRTYNDIYFSHSGGVAEAAHVFLDNNDLPARFRAGGFHHFTIAETGFGCGLNFLVAARCFLALAPANACLHFVSAEKFPLTANDLAQAHAQLPPLALLAGQLRAVYPPLCSGVHRRELAGGRIRLTLLFGAAEALMPRVIAGTGVQAWFLDGFAPPKNTDLWNTGLYTNISRLSAPGATFSTFTAVGEVKRGLIAAGFSAEKVAGFGSKRHMLRGSLAAAITDASIAAHNPPEPQRRAAVIGGGLAGCAAARALAERGWQVTLFERNASLADETSGNLAGAVYPKFSVHETPQNRWYRDSYLYALARLPAVLGEPDGHSWARCGLLQLPATANSGDTRICEAVTASGRWPETVVQHVDAPAASRLTGAALESGGLWFAGAAWVHPPALCRALATHPRITLRLNTAVNSLTHADAGMLANDERCDIAVIANALAANTFAQTADLPLRRVRGQVTHLTATPASSAWRAVVCHEGYVTPARDGVHCAGATFAPRDHDPSVRHDDHAENLGNLAAACPQMYAALGGEQCRVSGGRTGFRAQTPDYLPVIGGVAAITGCGSDAGIARVPGLFVLTALGAKGIAFSLLGAEIIAALASGEPLPVDSEVADAIDPARFLRRKQRKEAAAKQASTRINKPDAGATP